MIRLICDKVLDDNSLAEELLPTRSGFFFGSTDYDEWYFEDIKYHGTLLIKKNNPYAVYNILLNIKLHFK